MPDTQPFDANGECLICDEQGGHAANCGWLLGLLVEIELQEKNAQLQAAKIAELEQQAKDVAVIEHAVDLVKEKLQEQEQVITNQLRNLGELRRELDAREKIIEVYEAQLAKREKEADR